VGFDEGMKFPNRLLMSFLSCLWGMNIGCTPHQGFHAIHKAPQTPSVVRMVQIPQSPLHTFIPVTINDREALFLVDSGATVSAVSRKLAEELKLPTDITPDRQSTRTNIAGPIRLVKVRQLTIGHHEFHDFQAVALPMQHLENFLGRAVDGVIGMNILNYHRFGIDPSMVLFSFPHPGLNSEPIEIESHSNALWVKLPVQGVKLPPTLKIDTGADVTTLCPDDFWRLSNAGFPVHRGKVEQQLDVNRVRRGVMTQEIRVIAKLGENEQTDFPIRLGQHNLLGMDFFRSRILVLDPKGEHCWVGPRMTNTDTTAHDAESTERAQLKER